MNTRYRRLEAEFGPESGFEVQPVARASFRVSEENRFEQLKGRLLSDRLAEAWGAGSASRMRRAANEAAALAWVTSFPLLVFPALFEEKANQALLEADRQQRVRARSSELMML
jgi:hypothetical protein